MNNSKRKLRGFTLLELIIVIAIISIMAAILVPSVTEYMRTNRIRSANNQAQQIYMAAQDYLVNEQIKGTTTKDITGSDSPDNLCWIMVTTEQGYDDNAHDKSNKTTVVGSFGINQNTDTGFEVRDINGKKSYPIADGIESRLESGFEGAWVVAFYPSTFTVAYAVYNDYYQSTAECLGAVKLIGTNGGVQNATSCDDRLYQYEFSVGKSSTTSVQELDFAHPAEGITPHLYTGQFPIPYIG